MKQWQDKHTRRAFKEGYPARSVYKLQEINNRYRLLKKNSQVIDFGCHPGSWLKYLSQNCEKVLGIDLKETDTEGLKNVKTIVGDATELNSIEYLDFVDVIVSDMAPNTTGNSELDSYKSFELCLSVLHFCDKHLEKNGSLIMKYFQGEEEKELLQECKKRFSLVKCTKPNISRKNSKEMFIVAQTFK